MAAIVLGGGYALYQNSAQAETVKIGALYPLTGGLAQYGELAQKTAQIAIDEINAAGGINGKKVEIVIQDHKCDPKEAISVFEQLTSARGIKVFTSAACTGTVVSVGSLLEQKNAVLLTTVLSGPKASGVSPYLFRNYASDANEARLFAEEIRAKGYKKVAIINEETDYAKGLRSALEGYLKNSGVTIVGESFATGATDVRAQLTKLKAENADVVFVSPQTVTSGEVVLKQMEDLQFKPKHLFVNDNVIKSKDLVGKHAALLEGALGGDYIIPKTEAIQILLDKYMAKYGAECPQPNMCAVVYDTVNILVKAVAEKGENAQSVQGYLQSLQYAGITGTIAFDEKGDRKNADYALFEVKSGQAIMNK